MHARDIKHVHFDSSEFQTEELLVLYGKCPIVETALYQNMKNLEV